MYQLWIQIIKYGFSSVLFLAAGFILYFAYKETRSVRTLFRGFALTAYMLIAAGLLLMLFTGATANQLSLIFIKGVSTAFGLIYGIYATLNGFIETDANGKRIVTRLGVLGIFILSFNTVLVISMDYLSEVASMESKIQEKQEQLEQERERKIEYEKLLGSVSFVDRKTGDLKIDFQTFSESLYKSLVSVQIELKNTRVELSQRETELKDATARFAVADQNQRNLQEALLKTEKSLSTREAELKESQNRLGSSESNAKSLQEQLARSEKGLAVKESEWKDVAGRLGEREKELKKAQEDLLKVSRDLASRDAEASESGKRVLALDAALKQSQEDLKKVSLALAGKESEARELQSKILGLDAGIRKAQEDYVRAEKSAAGCEAELKVCRNPAPVPTTTQ
ncbi:MAG: hypothetical protein JNM27_05130 [Leptospirales bacterium]|nr:hypothetical protein [Leptospirales bacterium]